MRLPDDGESPCAASLIWNADDVLGITRERPSVARLGHRAPRLRSDHSHITKCASGLRITWAKQLALSPDNLIPNPGNHVGRCPTPMKSACGCRRKLATARSGEGQFYGWLGAQPDKSGFVSETCSRDSDSVPIMFFGYEPPFQSCRNSSLVTSSSGSDPWATT